MPATHLRLPTVGFSGNFTFFPAPLRVRAVARYYAYRTHVAARTMQFYLYLPPTPPRASSSYTNTMPLRFVVFFSFCCVLWFTFWVPAVNCFYLPFYYSTYHYAGTVCTQFCLRVGCLLFCSFVVACLRRAFALYLFVAEDARAAHRGCSNTLLHACLPCAASYPTARAITVHGYFLQLTSVLRQPIAVIHGSLTDRPILL